MADIPVRSSHGAVVWWTKQGRKPAGVMALYQYSVTHIRQTQQARWKADKNMDDSEFLDHLETRLGQRWSKEENIRFREIRPEGLALWYVSSTTVAKYQKKNIEVVRDALLRRATQRLGS